MVPCTLPVHTRVAEKRATAERRLKELRRMTAEAAAACDVCQIRQRNSRRARAVERARG